MIISKQKKENTIKKNKGIFEIWQKSQEYIRLFENVTQGKGPFSIIGVPDSAALHLLSALINQTRKPALIITHNEMEARKLFEDMSQLLEGLQLLTPKELQLSSFFAAGREIQIRRIAALTQWRNVPKSILIAPIESAIQAMPPVNIFDEAQFDISWGECMEPEKLLTKLNIAGYENVEKVDAIGQFRVAGGIIDIFIPGQKNPYRIEFFDNEIDSIRSFDISNQRSLEKIESIHVIPASEIPITTEALQHAEKQFIREKKKAKGKQAERLIEFLDKIQSDRWIEGVDQLLPYFYKTHSIIDYMPSDCLLIFLESKRIEQSVKTITNQFAEYIAQGLEDNRILALQSQLLFSKDDFWSACEKPNTLIVDALIGSSKRIKPNSIFQFALRSANQYAANLEMLATDLKGLQKNTSVIVCAGRHVDHMYDILSDFGLKITRTNQLGKNITMGELLLSNAQIPRGFESDEMKVLLLGEADIFGRSKRSTTLKRNKQSNNKIDLFSELKVGDFVVHEKHGIGQFKGIENYKSAGVSRDYLMIQYAGNDRVGVSTDELDRVQKYIGNAEKMPRISKLGGAEWTRAVKKARASATELAFDLVELYSAREARKGFAFSTDTSWQRELEDDFAYEETPGQLSATEDIKRDMESSRVMDRLLCGDVGYGKTEVAIRAIFKAVQDSKQVGFLVPTTILAQQQYLSLIKRFEGFPIHVDMLCRLRTLKEQKETIKRIRDGRCDVVVGTHRILGKDVEFKDLGLLVVDEEQRFGVAHKEQIKTRKKDVDVLSLSATPIPRTLHMSLTGIRDMSTIDTPPEERYPVQTYVMEYKDDIVREAILKEIGHSGQAYFLYNNVRTMESMLKQLQELIPEARFGIAHGQMPQGSLESTMLSFINHDFDVLLCSTIIESGLDIANVNTLIIYDADRYGVSQLYQLRGRVGRSNRIAYAFLTVRPDKSLSEIAEKRLRALREFTEFGSGFKIAMRDLEIRGAGNLLGSQQHGHLNEVGYDYYVRMIDEAVREAKGEKIQQKMETQLEFNIDAHISPQYIGDETQRLEMYKRIASIQSIEDYYDVQEEIEDRFGDIPIAMQNLLDISLLKAYAQKLGIKHISLQNSEARIKFSEHTAVDIVKLFELLKNIPHTQMLPGSQAILLFKTKNVRIEQLLKSTQELLNKMFSCISSDVTV